MRRRSRLERLRDLLTDTDGTAFLIARTAERLPVLETIELHRRLDRWGVTAGALV